MRRGSSSRRLYASLVRMRFCLCILGILLIAVFLCGCSRAKPPRQLAMPASVSAAAPVAPASVATVSLSVAVAKAYPEPATPTPTRELLMPTLPPMPTSSAPAPTVPAATATPSGPQTIRHVVKRGETIAQLSRVYRTTMSEIIRANPGITDPNNLKVGTVLTITVGAGQAARTHTVQRGETLYSIARKYNITPESLAQANGLTDPNRLAVGQVLVIP